MPLSPTQFALTRPRGPIRRRPGYRLAPPAVVSPPQTIVAAPAAQLTMSAPAPVLKVTLTTPSAILNLTAPVPILGNDIVVVAPPAILNLTAPAPALAFVFPAPFAVLTFSAVAPTILTVSVIPPAPAANLVMSMPIPCLKRTLIFTALTAGTTALEPLLEPDTCLV